jgi:putative transposase
MPERASTPYPWVLSDREWAFLAPLLPPARPGGRPRTVDLKKIRERDLPCVAKRLSMTQWRMLLR